MYQNSVRRIHVTGPKHRIGINIGRIADGDFTRRLMFHSRAELHELADELHRMVSNFIERVIRPQTQNSAVSPQAQIAIA